MPDIGEADVALLFGGDGTLHRHLGALLRLDIPVLIVPVGSGNDLARSIGIRSLAQSLAAWKKFCEGGRNIRLIDLGTITPLGEATAGSIDAVRHFCCVAGVGLDGEVSRRANSLPRWLRSHGGYAMSLLPAVFSFAPFPLKLSVANPTVGNWQERSHQAAMLAAVANTPMFGDGMNIAPHAKLDDGLLDVCVLSGVNPFKLFCMFPTVYAGKHLRIREVEYFTADKVKIETDRPIDVYADGEYVCQTPVEIAIRKACFKVIGP